MKKAIYICLTALLVLSAVLISLHFVFAEKDTDGLNFPVDSLNISDEIKEQLNINGDEKRIFRVYDTWLRFAFLNADNIDEMLVANHYIYPIPCVERTRIVVEQADGSLKCLIEYHYRDSVDISSGTLNPFKMYDYVLNEFNTNTAIKKISSDIKIKKVYFIAGQDTYREGTRCLDGNAIYYETDMGDYIYYFHGDTGELIFPIEDFCALQREIYATPKKNEYHPLFDNEILPTDVWSEEKLAQYDFNSDTFAFCLDNIPSIMHKVFGIPKLYLYIGAGVVVAAGVITAVILIKRKKKPTQEV